MVGATIPIHGQVHYQQMPHKMLHYQVSLFHQERIHLIAQHQIQMEQLIKIQVMMLHHNHLQ